MKRKIIKIKDTVQRILTKFPVTRDSDDRLLSKVWADEIQSSGNPIDKMTARDVLVMVWRGELPNPESIRRTRQRLQENYEELRGDNYLARQKEADEVKSIINDPELF